MSDEAKCAQCGAPLSVGAPEGLCPACLLKRGLETQTAGGPAADFTPPPLEKLARYFPQLEILELLGRGGMGVVYKARQRELDRIVALKILPSAADRDPAFAERFAREARALARLSHPNIVAVYDFGQTGGLFYFVMEYVDGLNLRQLLAAARITPREALAIVPQICDALQTAHDQGIVHRDIKPENILLDKKGRVKIADFGIAKIMGADERDMTLTGAGEVIGTPAYMAPEQIEHPREVDHRADIYSLGVVFYQMLTGELPLGKFAPPSRKVQIDIRLDEVVLRALEKEPELRYQQAAEVKTQVETITSSEHLPARKKPVAWPGIDFRSRATLFGLPLLHVASGIDPATGRKRVARGIIAVGDHAQGVFAFGGIALGVFAFGGFSGGVFAWGGFSIALLTYAGFGIGLIAALGGCALAPIAVGGTAIGYWSYGGMAYGIHALGSTRHDPAAMQFFAPWADRLLNVLWITWIVFPVILLIGTALPLLVRWRVAGKDSTARPHKAQIVVAVVLILAVIAASLGTALTFRLAVRDIPHASEVIATRAAAPSRAPTPERLFCNVQPDGTIAFLDTTEDRNESGTPKLTDRFSGVSDFVHVKGYIDAQGRDITFKEDLFGGFKRYTLTINEPIAPGQASSITTDGTMTGLIKPAGEPGVFEYYRNYWPGRSEKYTETHLLPVGAELLEKTPSDLSQSWRDLRIQLQIERSIPAGGNVELRYKYRLPSHGVVLIDPLKPPQGSNPYKSQVILNVKSDGSIFLDHQPISGERLVARLRELAKLFPDQAVILRGDSSTNYKSFVNVLDLCRQANIWNVAFATRFASQPTVSATETNTSQAIVESKPIRNVLYSAKATLEFNGAAGVDAEQTIRAYLPKDDTSVTVSAVQNTNLFEIIVSSTDPQLAATRANNLVLLVQDALIKDKKAFVKLREKAEPPPLKQCPGFSSPLSRTGSTR